MKIPVRKGVKLASNFLSRTIKLRMTKGMAMHSGRKSLIEKSKNGDFLYYPWGDDGWNGICVEFFSIKTQEYIDIIKPVLHYYDNNNPPGIREDWHGEWFFEWACKFSNLHPTMKNFCDVKHKSVMGSGGRDE